MIRTKRAKDRRRVMPGAVRAFGLASLVAAGLVPSAMAADPVAAEPRLWRPWADLPPTVAPAGTNPVNIFAFARWADRNAGKGFRGPQPVEPEALASIHAERLRTPRRPSAAPGAPAECRYAFGGSIAKLDWSDHALLTHNGSNQFNLAKIGVDEERDPAIVVATDIGGSPAHDGVERVVAALYERFR